MKEQLSEPTSRRITEHVRPESCSQGHLTLLLAVPLTVRLWMYQFTLLTFRFVSV